jgi:hypothetical protein
MWSNNFWIFCASWAGLFALGFGAPAAFRLVKRRSSFLPSQKDFDNISRGIARNLSPDCRAVLRRLTVRQPAPFETLRSAVSHSAFLTRAVERLGECGLVESGFSAEGTLYIRLTERGERVAALLVSESELAA